MILIRLHCDATDYAIPRMGGGDPDMSQIAELLEAYSPHGRG